jgi:acyl-CoA-binding protein
MTLKDKISSKVHKMLTLCVGFCLFLSFASYGQGERDRNSPDLPKNSDSIGQFEGQETSSFENRSDNTSTKDINQNPNNAQVKKENPLFKQGGEKDVKKEGMSTLSFNLFLYIVDKFKED